MKVALIGGHARSARALVRLAQASEPGLQFIAFVRREAPVGQATEIRHVTDYAAIGAADLAGCDAAINFVGATNARDRAEFDRVNARLPAALAAEAKRAGVGQFIHLSSLSIHGRTARIGPQAAIAPVSDYGRSKAEAETGLRAIGDDRLAVALLRIPTVYGPGEPSKIGTLATALGWLPAFAVPATLPGRSVISHDNLARVLLELLATSRGGTFYAADPEPFDIGLLASVLAAKPRLLHLPQSLFRPLKALAPSLYNSLYEAMQIHDALLLRPERYPLRATQSSLADAFGARGASH